MHAHTRTHKHTHTCAHTQTTTRAQTHTHTHPGTHTLIFNKNNGIGCTTQFKVLAWTQNYELRHNRILDVRHVIVKFDNAHVATTHLRHR